MSSATPAGREHRLVRGSKSDTNPPPAMPGEYEAFLQETPDVQDAPELDTTRAGKMLYVTREDWSGEYMATAVVQVDGQQRPPPQEGDRWTNNLTRAAARKIEKSAKWLSQNRRGYKAFITLTFTPEQRAILELHDHPGAFRLPIGIHGPVIPGPRASIGREVTRFIKGLQQVKKRGLVVQDEHGKKAMLRGTPAPFLYTWVAENPWAVDVTPYGPGRKRNPHVHLMLNWTVKKRYFKAWAARIEKLWGHGYAHIERLRKPASAGAYMAKAANYMSKAAGSDDQGPIRGNRYAIAQNARAPLPRLIACYALQFLRDAIRLGRELGRAAWPKGLYFHAHGFGATDATAWGNLWTALKADGFKFNQAIDLHRARLARTMTQLFDPHRLDPLGVFDYRRYCDFIRFEAPPLSLAEFEAAYQ